MNKYQLKILENNFNIYSNEDGIIQELEQWTNGGVDMIININYDEKLDIEIDIVEELEEYLENFDIDYEIDMYRQSEDYRNNFRITESVKDFENWVKFIENVIKELKECE